MAPSDPPFVDLRLGTQPDALAWIRFPAPGAVAAALPPRIVHTALIRLPQNGSIWLLRATGIAWTDLRLGEAAAVLARPLRQRSPERLLSKDLADALPGPAVEVVLPELAGADWPRWDTRNVAVAHAVECALASSADGAQRTNATSGAAGELARSADAVHRAIRDSLQAAHERFFEALDREALQFAGQPAAGALAYNFLVAPEHRRNRVQFAHSFPLLLRSAARGDAVADGLQLRRIVDDALPFVRALSRAWAVSPAALRCLAGRPVGVIGEAWADRPRILVSVLDALRPEDRPTHDPRTWERFNRIVGDATELFGRGLTATVARSWIRETAARTRRGQAVPPDAQTFDGEFVAAVEALRQALIDTLAHAALRETLSPDPDREARARGAADGFLCRLSPKRLGLLASAFRRQLREARDASAPGATADGRAGVAPTARDDGLAGELGGAQEGAARQHGELTAICELAGAHGGAGPEFWPLLPEAYLSRDGTRRVVPLCSHAALQRHGRSLSTCLAKSSLEDYARQCARGQTFIVGVFDTARGTPVSTAELQPRPSGVQLAHPTIRVVQHTAAHNGVPSPACRAAIREVTLALLEVRHYRQHLRGVMRKARVGFDRRREAQMNLQEAALRAALGDRRFDAMLSSVAGRNADESDAEGQGLRITGQ